MLNSDDDSLALISVFKSRPAENTLGKAVVIITEEAKLHSLDNTLLNSFRQEGVNAFTGEFLRDILATFFLESGMNYYSDREFKCRYHRANYRFQLNLDMPSTASNRSLSSLFAAKNKPSLELFNIELDNNRTIYLPGQRIEGHVAVSFSELTMVKLLRVRVSGSISTQVYKNSSSSGNQLSCMTLFKDYVNLGGSGNMEGQLIELTPGESVFPFSFRLPLSLLPASFSGAYGRIKYEISAVLMAPGLSKQIKTIPITIPSTIPNTNDNFSSPVIAESILPIRNFLRWEVRLSFDFRLVILI